MVQNKEKGIIRAQQVTITNATLARETIRLFGPLLLFFAAIYFLLAFSLLAIESQVIETMAVRDAKSYTRALTEFRTLYTSEVVENVRHNGITISHNYENLPSAIPLPATLSMLLGKNLHDKTGGKVRLYSAYPFPWRAHDGGPQDAFEVEALTALATAPETPFYRFERVDDVQVLRYASADLMRESCVDCHNSHPNSPKKDWQVGEVRGVLSLTRPLLESVTDARLSQEIILALMIGLGLWGMALLALLGTRHRRNAFQADRQALESARANEQLQRQIVETKAAETDRRKMEAQVQHSQKLDSIGILAGGLAHDFNNLLQTLLSNTELALLRMNADENELAKTNLEKVLTVSAQASKLTQQLLVYAGKASVLKQAVDISQIVTNLRPLLETLCTESVSIRYELEEPLSLVYADPTQLQQVVINLTTNAKQALEGPERTIAIRTFTLSSEYAKEQDFILRPGTLSSTETFAILEIQDNGSGIPLAVQSRIFDPFYSTKRQSKGRGLGLAVTHGIVSAHMGGIQLNSEPGAGTSIRIFFPLTSLPSSRQDPPIELAVSGPTTTAKLLVVDDDSNVGDALTKLLKQLGYLVIHAPDGESAINHIKRENHAISLVLLDLQMPKMNGVATLAILREFDPTIPVILTSGNAPDETVQELVDSNSVSFLPKPHTSNQLLALLEDTLRKL